MSTSARSAFCPYHSESCFTTKFEREQFRLMCDYIRLQLQLMCTIPKLQITHVQSMMVVIFRQYLHYKKSII